MELKLITFELDDTQFLVNVTGIDPADVNRKAIDEAIKANFEVGGLIDEEDYSGITKKDAANPQNYSVEDVDWDLLRGIIQREDWGCLKNSDVMYFSN